MQKKGVDATFDEFQAHGSHLLHKVMASGLLPRYTRLRFVPASEVMARCILEPVSVQHAGRMCAMIAVDGRSTLGSQLERCGEHQHRRIAGEMQMVDATMGEKLASFRAVGRCVCCPRGKKMLQCRNSLLQRIKEVCRPKSKMRHLLVEVYLVMTLVSKDLTAESMAAFDMVPFQHIGRLSLGGSMGCSMCFSVVGGDGSAA